jgi:hypothetical protein
MHHARASLGFIARPSRTSNANNTENYSMNDLAYVRRVFKVKRRNNAPEMTIKIRLTDNGQLYVHGGARTPR